MAFCLTKNERSGKWNVTCIIKYGSKGGRKLLEIGSVNFPSDGNISFPFGWTRYWHTVIAKAIISIWILATRPTEFIRSSQVPNYCDWTWMMMKRCPLLCHRIKGENEKPLKNRIPSFLRTPCSLGRLTENSSSLENFGQKRDEFQEESSTSRIRSPIYSNDRGSLHVPSIRQ